MKTASPDISSSVSVSGSRPKHKGYSMKILSHNFAADQIKRRKWFSSMMWRAFPGASVREKALRAAPVLSLTPRQCENLMNGEHDAKLGTILAVLAIAGAENIFEIVGGNHR